MIEDSVSATLRACDRLRALRLPITPAAIEEELTKETTVTYAESLERTLRAADHLRALGRDITTESLADELSHGGCRCAECSPFAPPDPYAPGLQLRAASTPPRKQTFEDKWKADRWRELEAEHERREEWNDAHPLPPRLTAAETSEYVAPNPYCEDNLRKHRENGR